MKTKLVAPLWGRFYGDARLRLEHCCTEELERLERSARLWQRTIRSIISRRAVAGKDAA